MLLNRLTSEMVCFVPGFENWEEAIKTASKPLLEKGNIKESYVEAMINNVKEYGPYIVLMPKVAMPHARPEDGVIEMGVSLMITEKSVPFDEEKSANIFFVIAASDATSHLALLTEISDFLTNEEKVEKMLTAKNYHEIITLLRRNIE